IQVSADQVTILGDGSTHRPLRSAIAGASTFLATYIPGEGGPIPIPGMPLAVSTADPVHGIASVTPGTAAAADDDGLANVIGSVLLVDDDGGVTVRSAGVVSLTETAWDAVTGDTGGLVPRGEYYLSLSPGRLTQTPPTAPGTFFS